uniref:Uncharacterized protein n=1 Tax=Anguilla anguilla TaxID=7936 RepID=A0A0E9WLG6_ANGAN
MIMRTQLAWLSNEGPLKLNNERPFLTSSQLSYSTVSAGFSYTV